MQKKSSSSDSEYHTQAKYRRLEWKQTIDTQIGKNGKRVLSMQREETT
jgi:hypothetical protein